MSEEETASEDKEIKPIRDSRPKINAPDKAAVLHKVNSSIMNMQKKHASGNKDAGTSSEHSSSDEVNLCISNGKLDQLATKRTIAQKISKIMRREKPMKKHEFEDCAMRLYKCCLKSIRDLHELHMRRIIAMQLFEEIILRAKGSYISIRHVIHLTWSIMSCIHHFQLRLRTNSTGIVYKARLKQTRKCMNIFYSMIRIFKPYLLRIVLSAIITFYREGKLWEDEFACTDLLVYLMEIYPDPEEAVHDIIFTVEHATLTIIEARYLTAILYAALNRIKWPKVSEKLLKTFLSMLDSSILPAPTDLYYYPPLRKGLELCIKNLMSNINHKDLIKLFYFCIKRINDDNVEDAVYCFGSLAVFAAQIYSDKYSQRDISKGPLPLIFGLFYSNKPLIHLLGVQIWQNLIDRHNNAKHFYFPRIFFQECDYKISIAKSKDTDKAFFKSVRNIMYDIAMNIFINGSNQVTFENNYQAIALTLVEIPCGYTASCYVTVAMSLQEYAFQISKEQLVRSNHLHAIVLSMMTLICNIHNAKIFYSYVNSIMERRAEWAPHLNPPLKSKYEYAQHHILWNKPELFFEDWEARYGLWKCFRGRKIKRN